jgi:hypothetical protein
LTKRNRRHEWSRTTEALANAPLPPLQPFQRCQCGTCPECRSNAKWDRIFAKFELKQQPQKIGMFRSPLSDI